VETHVKERLTGALILVALLVILVPEILPGPFEGRAATKEAPPATAEGPPLRSFSLELGADGRAVESDQSALAPQAAAAPVETPEAADQGKPEPARSEIPEVVATEPAPVAAKPVVETPARADSWWVQLGSFSQEANAQRLVQSLTKAGFDARISPLRSKDKTLYRVRAGPAANRAAAEGLRTRLADAGHNGTLVAP